MSLVHIGKFSRLDEFMFADLPKGVMLELSMNAYNGNVFCKLSNRQASSVVALELMRELVDVCDVLEQAGSTDPLGDFLAGVDGSFVVNARADAARKEIKAFSGNDEGGDNGFVQKVAG